MNRLFSDSVLLEHEPTTISFFEHALVAISCAVQEVDCNAGCPKVISQGACYNQIPDALYCPFPGANPQLHLEFKSWSAFSCHGREIVELGCAGRVLVLSSVEMGA